MSNNGQAYEQSYNGEKAVWLTWGSYEAAVLPEIGANLIAFRDTEKGYRILHEPAANEMEEFKANPGIHGIPVLFPPNRYEDGRFDWNGRSYEFPVNEPATGNHLHGFAHTAVWNVEDYGVTKTESYVVLQLSVDENHDIYRFLPHRFSIKLRYSLNGDGLLQHVSVHNEGNDALPCMIAFHTAINAPFTPNSTKEDYTMKLTIGNRWELNERMLPTGKFQPLSAGEEAIKSIGVNPFWEPMDNHYTTEPRNGRNQMELTDSRENVTLVYDVGTSYKQWMVWNQHPSGKFFCPEPQLNLVNAPNVDLPADEIGLVTLEPQGIWEQSSRIYLKQGN
ncbi:aldose 1-epimerase [Paenibacillus sp. NEAU-GSW1]|uniref:aldose 1-epimerase n=1 Tax=Paenibacillus sp. NEAU-GSW1 TaxID=2682486 RepID=UPI00139E7451|nr:aldose 1-epimerase [Paenibacillus sp. NEAU-GSW1]